MRKRGSLLLAVCVLLLSGCGARPESVAVQNEETSGAEELNVGQDTSLDQSREPDRQENGSAPSEQVERTDAEVKKLELMMDLRWNAYEELRDRLIRIEQLGDGMSEEEIQELVQSEILRCYEENTLLAVEIKTVVMGSLGCSVPAGFATGDDVMSDYGNYVMNTLTSMIDVQGVIDEVASPEVQELLKNGVEGAISGYQSGGNLEDALQGAIESLTIGVAAGIQEKAEEFAVAILDETTLGLFSVVQEISEYDSIEDYFLAKADEEVGGLIGSVAGIVDYDTTPGALLQSISDTAGRSAAEVKAFLNREAVTSKEIGAMMYEYSQFGNAMFTLFQYGGSGYFNWQPNYDKMETLYGRFLRNEIMIEMLSRRGEITNPVSIGETESGGNGEKERQFEYLYEKPGLTKQEEGLDNATKFDILTAELEALEGELSQMEDLAESSPDLTAGLEEYRRQIEEINTEYKGILEYSVQNFEAKYDESGIEKIQEINSKNHAIGEIAKYTPYGIVINLLTASTIADSDIYYEGMQSANETFSKAYQNAALEARNSVAALEARTAFYEELVAESEEPEDEYRNMYLLQYMLGDGKVDVEQYGQEVKKNLYLLATQIDAMGRVYGSLYMDPSAANAYGEQYRALMDILDPYGSGEVALLVSDEEYAATLQPVLEAGASAILALQGSPHPSVENKLMMLYRDDNTPGGKMRYCLCGVRLIHVYHTDNWVDIYYYSDGEPLCINGRYVYNGLILNGTEEMDAATACEEARWIYQNVRGDQRSFQVQCAEHIGRLKKALGQN
ncbi:MAG: hypothetical protein HFH87_10945 [Lachnospiraceae bacterium]|nr:hypothetical protein [Lachnospiraceae bacterium]